MLVTSTINVAGRPEGVALGGAVLVAASATNIGCSCAVSSYVAISLAFRAVNWFLFVLADSYTLVVDA